VVENNKNNFESSDIVGTTIGRYTILGKIGAGGMAEVFLARSRGAGGIDKILVLKKIHPVLAKNKRFIDMFMEEARVAMRLNHSNIVQVYAFEQINENFILAMEHVDGSDLLEIQTLAWEAGHRIPFGLCAFITAEIAKGLNYSHNRKDDHGVPLELVHRDVSPQNVLISKNGGVKVTDFGIVKAKSMNEEIGEVKGKLGYMSPQQARGLHVDHRADIFSLGVVLHELLVGATRERPKIGETVELEPPVLINQDVPEQLSRITMRALEPDPDDRYQTAREMIIDLNSYLRTEPEIYDATSLEEWIEQTIPAKKLQKVNINDEELDTGATTTVYEEQTVNLRVIGEFEQQAAVMISVKLKIEQNRDSSHLQKEFNRLAEDIAYKNRGIFQKTADVIRIYLGLPKSVLEDSISAIIVAQDLMDVVTTLSKDHKSEMSAQIAINRGSVKTTKEITGQPVQFQDISDLVQMSDLLLNAARPGEIITGKGVFDIAKNDYHFSDPVTVVKPDSAVSDYVDTSAGYVVLRVKSRIERNISSESNENQFFGRNAILQTLAQRLDQSQKNRPVILRLTGDLGLGKSSVVRELIKKAKFQGCTVLRNECLFAEKDIPLAAAAATIRTLLGIDDIFNEQGLSDSLNKLLGSVPAYKQRQFNFFSSLLVSPAMLWEKNPAKRRELIRQTAFGIGVILSQISPPDGLLLIIDNAHWMDGPTVDVLSELARNMLSIPVFLVLAGQPETLAYRHIEHMETQELRELSNTDMKRLIEARIGTHTSTKEVTGEILARSHGNPFFANEIIDSLISRGILEPSGSKNGHTNEYKQSKPGVIVMPTTIQGIAESRINTLNNAERTVLRTAAVIGSKASKTVLTQIIGRDITQNLETLIDKGFLVPYTRTDEQGGVSKTLYNFKRAIEREAAYEGLSRSDRISIHQKLARKFIKEEEEKKPVPPVQIAWHLDKSEQFDLAAQYYIKAAEAAIHVYSARRAARLIDRALTITPPGTTKRYDALLKKERIIRDIGIHDIHLETIKEMEELGHQCKDFSMQATAAYRHSRYLYYEGNFDEAATMINSALRMAKKAGDTQIMVESLRELGYLAIEEGSLKDAMDCVRWAFDIIHEDSEDIYLKARIMGLEGLIFMEMGILSKAVYPLVYAMMVFRKLGDKRNESVQLANLALLAQARGFLMEALSFIEHALSIDREIKDISERGRKQVSYADIRIELGQIHKGELLLDDSLKLCQNNFEPFGELEAKLGLADLFIQKGQEFLAQELLNSLKEQKFLNTSAMSLARHRRLTTEMYIGLKQFDTAVSAAEDAVDVAERSGMNAEVIHGVSLHALALAYSGDHDFAQDEVYHVEELMKNAGLVRNTEKIWWRCAGALHIAGNFKDRDEAIHKAQVEAQRKLDLIEDQKHKKLFKNHPLIFKILSGTGMASRIY
jgi:serine/threonine protein kinase/tetratricopeptide (TPR) repeat protein